MLLEISQEKPKGLAEGRGAPHKAPRGGGALERFFVSQAYTKILIFVSHAYKKNAFSLMYTQENRHNFPFSYLYISIYLSLLYTYIMEKISRKKVLWF
jgi:hypothetical protein